MNIFDYSELFDLSHGCALLSCQTIARQWQQQLQWRHLRRALFLRTSMFKAWQWNQYGSAGVPGCFLCLLTFTTSNSRCGNYINFKVLTHSNYCSIDEPKHDGPMATRKIFKRKWTLQHFEHLYGMGIAFLFLYCIYPSSIFGIFHQPPDRYILYMKTTAYAGESRVKA